MEVAARDGDDPTDERRFEVRLRGNGRGTSQFIVPVGWGSVVLACQGSRDHVVAVALPP